MSFICCRFFFFFGGFGRACQWLEVNGANAEGEERRTERRAVELRRRGRQRALRRNKTHTHTKKRGEMANYIRGTNRLIRWRAAGARTDSLFFPRPCGKTLSRACKNAANERLERLTHRKQRTCRNCRVSSHIDMFPSGDVQHGGSVNARAARWSDNPGGSLACLYKNPVKLYSLPELYLQRLCILFIIDSDQSY